VAHASHAHGDQTRHPPSVLACAVIPACYLDLQTQGALYGPSAPGNYLSYTRGGATHA
jgi:hypothetical protein